MTLEELKTSGKLIECEQGSEEWFQARLGMVTASKFAMATSKARSKDPKAVSKVRFSYMCALLAERTTGNLVDTFQSKTMDWGVDSEMQALTAYHLETGNSVDRVGFVKYDDSTGASPDGLVGDDGMVQFKCPDSHTHIAYLLNRELPSVYKKQVHGEMWVCGRQWSDFVSYDPRQPYKDIMIVRVQRDEKIIKELVDGLTLFVQELLKQEKFIKNGV